MEQVQQATQELITAVLQSSEYIRYQDAKLKIAQYPILKKRADEFRRHNYSMQNGNADIFAEADSLRQEYAYITQNDVVWEYLEAEVALCRIVQRVNWKLMESLDFDAGLGE